MTTIGGSQGTAFALNNSTGIAGPICGDDWSLNNVSLSLSRILLVKANVTDYRYVDIKANSPVVEKG